MRRDEKITTAQRRFLEDLGFDPPEEKRPASTLISHIKAAEGVNGSDEEYQKRIQRLLALQKAYLGRHIEHEKLGRGTVEKVHLVHKQLTVRWDDGHVSVCTMGVNVIA